MLTKIEINRIWLYQLATFGVYFFVWAVRGRGEINRALNKKEIPSAWWFALPFGGYWWMWQYANALDELSNSRISRMNTYLFYIIATLSWRLYPTSIKDTNDTIMTILLLIIGHAFCMAMIQTKINNLRVIVRK